MKKDTNKVIDWSVMATVWACYETMGVSPDTLPAIQNQLKSPILIIGGGGGINLKYLRDQGFEVEAIDDNPNMIDYAKRVRGLEITQSSGTALPFEDQRFNSVIFATGVYNRVSLYEPFALGLMDEAVRVSKPDATIVAGFFLSDPKLEYIFRILNLTGDVSNNPLFMNAGDLSTIKRRFHEETEIPSAAIDHVFNTQTPMLTAHAELMREIEKVLREQSIDAENFASANLGFHYNDLEQADEEYLLAEFSKRFTVTNDPVLQLGDVRILMARQSQNSAKGSD